MTFDQTPKRLRVAGEVDRREIRWYHFLQPEARNVVSDNVRTDTVSALAGAGIVDIGTAEPGSYSVPTLTDYGREWADLPADEPAEPWPGSLEGVDPAQPLLLLLDDPPRPPYGTPERAAYDAEHGPAPWMAEPRCDNDPGGAP